MIRELLAFLGALLAMADDIRRARNASSAEEKEQHAKEARDLLEAIHGDSVDELVRRLDERRLRLRLSKAGDKRP